MDCVHEDHVHHRNQPSSYCWDYYRQEHRLDLKINVEILVHRYAERKQDATIVFVKCFSRMSSPVLIASDGNIINQPFV